MAWIWSTDAETTKQPLPEYDYDKNNKIFNTVFSTPGWIDPIVGPAIYRLKNTKMQQVKKHQILSYQKLVQGDALSIFQSLPKSEVQLYPTEIHCKDGIIYSFFAVRPQITRNCTDIEKSKIIWMYKNEFYYDWRRLVYIENCMKENFIVFEGLSSKYVISDPFMEKLLSIDAMLKPDFVRPKDLENIRGVSSAYQDKYFWILGNKYKKFWL